MAMRLTKTALAVEIAILLGLFVGAEWLASILTDTRENFVVGLLVDGIYLAIRLATSARKPFAGSGRVVSPDRDHE
jgi:hypothetical protein